jgi:hypothetical protein
LPTFERTESFYRDYEGLTRDQRKAVKRALDHFIEDLSSDGKFRKGLRVKGVKGASGIFEMTWADDGRATFEYGNSIIDGEPHIIWRRIGTHDILG